MRIISGKNRGLKLTELRKGDSGVRLRPTSDRVRESLFNVLQNNLDFNDLVVLDLFAGTGALGLEAISRGAESVTFVEKAQVCQKIIQKNGFYGFPLEINDRAGRALERAYHPALSSSLKNMLEEATAEATTHISQTVA